MFGDLILSLNLEDKNEILAFVYSVSCLLGVSIRAVGKVDALELEGKQDKKLLNRTVFGLQLGYGFLHYRSFQLYKC